MRGFRIDPTSLNTQRTRPQRHTGHTSMRKTEQTTVKIVEIARRNVPNKTYGG